MSQTAASPALPTTIGTLREAHIDLMRQWRALGDDDEKAALAEELRAKIRRAGREIANPAERDEAQGLLDYWISSAASLDGQPYPSLESLDKYDAAVSRRFEDSAREVYGSLVTEEERRVARALFEDLLTKGASGNERAVAYTRTALQRRLGGKMVDPVLAAFEATGAVVRSPGPVPEADTFQAAEDLFQATSANFAKTWPELGEWLAERDAYTLRREILLSRVQEWNQSGRGSALLLRGADLRDIDRFFGETDTLNAFIEASKRVSTRFRSIAIAVLCVVVVAFAVLAWLALQKSKLAEQNVKEELAAAQAALERRETAEVYKEITGAAPGTDAKLSERGPEAQLAIPRLNLKVLEGAVWLGSNEYPQVAAPVWRSAMTPLGRARAGTAYRVLADINLRERMPPLDGSYVSQQRKAVIRAGTLLLVTGRPNAYERPSGSQFWAPVQVVPTIYIQYSGGTRARVQQLRQRLTEAGFDVPEAEEILSARGRRELRYFNQADRGIAELLIKRLGTENLACRSFAGSRASNRFALEIWVDPGARPSGSTACQ